MPSRPCRTIEALEDNRRVQLSLFPEDREPPAECRAVQVRMDRLELSRPRQWGACWLALELWEQLGLDEFWSDRLRPSREGTHWLNVLKTLACYRLIEPGSEWRLHRYQLLARRFSRARAPASLVTGAEICGFCRTSRQEAPKNN